MATTITVRDLPEDVRDTLASRAALSGQSLQEYMRGELIRLAARPTVAELMARVEARKAATGTMLDVAQLLADRDADRT